jgi:uncharacterized protein YycO
MGEWKCYPRETLLPFSVSFLGKKKVKAVLSFTPSNSSSMLKLFLYTSLLLIACTNTNNKDSATSLTTAVAQTFSFKEGDLIFQDLDCGELCDAIEKVTSGINGHSFSHIGIVVKHNGSLAVAEAIGRDVHITALLAFLDRKTGASSNAEYVVGRLKPKYSHLHKKAMAFLTQQIGLPYDDEFIYDNGKYYCSELIYDAYKHANSGQPFFELEPMTFKDSVSKKTLAVWEKYYAKLGRNIPEGEEGCNPAGLSKSEKLDIIKED